MKRASVSCLAALLSIVILGCAGRRQTITVPPRIDLKQHEMIGVIEFDAHSEGDLASFATRRFTEEARRDQGLVRIVEFGSQEEALASVGRDDLGPETYRELGRKHGVRTILLGELTFSEMRPDVRLTSLRSGSLSAQIEATLDVRLIETASGASLWSSSARTTQSVGQVSVFEDGGVVFDAEDPERAYGGLVDALVARVTRDFHATRERR